MMLLVIKHLDLMEDVDRNFYYQMEIQQSVTPPANTFVALNGDFVEWQTNIVSAASASTTEFRNQNVRDLIFVNLLSIK